MHLILMFRLLQYHVPFTNLPSCTKIFETSSRTQWSALCNMDWRVGRYQNGGCCLVGWVRCWWSHKLADKWLVRSWLSLCPTRYIYLWSVIFCPPCTFCQWDCCIGYFWGKCYEGEIHPIFVWESGMLLSIYSRFWLYLANACRHQNLIHIGNTALLSWVIMPYIMIKPSGILLKLNVVRYYDYEHFIDRCWSLQYRCQADLPTPILSRYKSYRASLS